MTIETIPTADRDLTIQQVSRRTGLAEVLGWQPRSTSETLEDTARSLLDAGLASAG